MEFLKVVSRMLPKFDSAFAEEFDKCEEVYGVFPCSTTLGGNLFLLILYGFLLLKAAGLLSDGSELLLTVLNPGIIGGLVLPILGALPDALLILMSGVSASAEDAQAEVLVGMGLLAGSNIFLLTLLWGGSLLVGRNDLIRQSNGLYVAKDKTLTKGWSLTQTGVTTDNQTRVASWIMMITVLPYLVAQTPVFFGWSGQKGSYFVLAGLIICLLMLASYCVYQVSFPWIQERWIYRATLKVRRSSALHHMAVMSETNHWGSLLRRDGTEPNRDALLKLFDYFDEDHNEKISEAELKGLVKVLGLERGEDKESAEWLKEFDLDRNVEISKDEFVKGMEKWIRDSVAPSLFRQRSPSTRRMQVEAASDASDGNSQGRHALWVKHRKEAQTSLTALLEDQAAEEEEEDEEESRGQAPTKAQVITKAVGLLILGALIAGIVADPLVDAVGNLSAVSGISSFFISFVATPLATNSSEAISSLLFAKRRRKKNISLTYSQIYGAITMNNTLCLAVFLAIVFFRDLTWNFTAEVSVILAATVVIGSLASFKVTFPSWMAIVALILYPLSIALLALLDGDF